MLVKLTQQKQEAKDTETRKVYMQCLHELKKHGGHKDIMRSQDERLNEENNSAQPIRNIFKMSRILVEPKDKVKKKSTRKTTTKNLSKFNEILKEEGERESEKTKGENSKEEESTEQEYDYSESSEDSEDDSDDPEQLQKIAKQP